jgi:hypothetical protein
MDEVTSKMNDTPSRCFDRKSGSGARGSAAPAGGGDWANFLAARSAEMADGAKLVSLSIGRAPEVHGWEWALGELLQAAVETADDGLLSPAELSRYTSAPRHRGIRQGCGKFPFPQASPFVVSRPPPSALVSGNPHPIWG